VLLKIISLFKKKALWLKSDDDKYRNNEKLPRVSVLIAAYNEDKIIEEKIQNFLSLNYPKDKIELIVGSDASSDSTNEIVEKYCCEKGNIRLFILPKRCGKAAVLNHITKTAQGEILIFSDANTIFNNDSILLLTKYFVNSRIGGVSGRVIWVNNNEENITGICEKTYWDFETETRRLESAYGKPMGLNGGIYAIRKNLYRDIPIDRAICDDLIISLKVIEQGYDLILEEKAYGTEFTNSLGKEFKRKIRIQAGNWNSIPYLKFFMYHMPDCLFFWSHKMLRWLSPFFLILIMLVNIFLTDYYLFKCTLILQLIFYSAAFIGYILDRVKIRIVLFYYPFYFILAHLAILIGFYKSIFNLQKPYW